MDDTQQSRASDAAATRKRRSSILKSQRAPRTPFSELEFNVATPTDTAKSRRVSFSRRTGVAEFVTNEATTTWKNFYEEHNKSLESSGNESGANAPRAPVGHIGKRIFDQQFQEVEAVDFGSTLDNHSLRNANGSMNNVNFTQQLASLECTADDKLAMPAQNFDMSAFTDHQSKLFGDDLAVPDMGEMSGRIDINFSAIQTIGEVKDDLDEIQKDLERVQSNVVCPGPFTGRKSLSEYIEVDLNATHVTMKNDDDDMSITDTIQSPKVQDVSKNCSSSQVAKKASFSQDWVADKENIALNPYVTPEEATNFAINDESDKILVFDGKRLTVHSDKEAEIILKSSQEDFKPLVPKESKPHQRKTIVLNVNDDLPNFVDDPMSTSVGLLGASFKHSVMFDDDISITQPVVAEVLPNPESNVTLVNENEIGDISLTQAVSNVILPAKEEKRRTIVFENDNCDISMTQALPSKIMATNPDKSVSERRRTILYENDTGDISITQAIPANIIVNKNSDEENLKSKTLVFDNVEGDISMTQVVPANLILSSNDDLPVKDKTIPIETEKRRTIVFENDNCDISMTQVLPANIIPAVENKAETGRRRTILYDDDMGDISVTQVIPSNILLNEKTEVVNDKSKTIIYDDIETDISMTQAVPTNLLLPANVHENQPAPVDNEKRKTIVFDDNECDISVTRALPSNIIIPTVVNQDTEKRRTILYDNDVGDVSITQAIPANILVNNDFEKDKFSNLVDKDTNTVSLIPDSQALSNLVLSLIADPEDKNKTLTTNLGNISVNSTVPNNIVLSNESANEKRKTIMFEDSSDNISITQALPANIFVPEKLVTCEKIQSIVADKTADISVTQAVLVNVVIVNNATEKRDSLTCDNNADVEMTEQCDTLKESADNESVSHTSDVQDIRPIKADTILPEIDKTENEIDNDSDVIKNPNVIPENMSLTKTSPKGKLLDRSKIYGIENNQITSSDSLIYIIRDTEGETQTEDEDKPNKSLKWKDNAPKLQYSPLSIEYKEETDREVTVDLPKKMDELRSAYDENSPTKNRHYEKMVSSDADKSKCNDLDMSRAAKSFKDANDTNELLEMLSDLTDKRCSKDPERPIENSEANEPRRLSVAPNRLSIVLSREDLLNNISMAQAALQRSIEMDETMDDTASETPLEVNMPSKKAARVSNEVVKKLQFEEDESTSETSLKSDVKSSPLKKTAFGETSYMKDNKSKVIPSYLKDVSDDIKALMNDLVKPNADTVPFQAADKSLNREPSTCSTQIQANLITSSQVDLDTELNSMADSAYDLDKVSMPSLERSHSLRSSLKSDVERHHEIPPEISFRPKRLSASPPSQDRVIVFDHNNPLNNICLAPIDFSEVHRYNPPKSNDTLCTDTASLKSKESERMNTQFVGNVTVTHTMQPCGDSVPDKSDAQSLLSNTSKRTSMDESVSVRVCEVKDTKMNTLIAMKNNKDLLEASSSLTLVDDALARNNFDVDLDMVPTQSLPSTNSRHNSPVKVIYHNEDQRETAQKMDSDLTSNDEMSDSYKMETKGKKRNYSPTKRDKHKYCALSALDITPKPTTKMQKLSNSPIAYVPDSQIPEKVSPQQEPPQRYTAEKEDGYRSKSSVEVESSDGKDFDNRKRSPRKSKSPKSKKPGTNVTVQQLITEYDFKPGIDQDALNKQIIEALSRSVSSTADTASLADVHEPDGKIPEAVSSFTSSKNQNEMREACSATTTETRTTSSCSRSMKIDSQPEMSECESSVNVVAKIDMLPFMGSHECEWEASGVDTWCFRLLHSRLRLVVRLAHRHDNATRTRVRADTPVLGHALETTHKESKKNTVATVCVNLAAEAMRYYLGQGCARAGDVPALLRRCAALARLALRWGRAMHDARLHLAYALAPDGRLALKVANIPLRSVWEVSMRLELVVGDAKEAPWPRAGCVRVARVVSDVSVPEDELRRLLAPLPRDWGHVPRTIWKIFRYLKNKTREDDILGL